MSSITYLKTSLNFIISNQALYNIYKAPRGKPLNLNYVHKRTMLTTLKRNTPSMHLARETLYKFSARIHPLMQLSTLDDSLIIKTIINFTHENYACLNRASQLALAEVFNTYSFKLEKSFSSGLVIDPLNPTSCPSNIHHSTLFNIVVVEKVKCVHTGLNIEVLQPANNGNIKNIDVSTELQSQIQLSKKLTGNTFPDLKINGIYYDLKFTKNPLNTKNHLYYMPLSIKSIEQVQEHLNILIRLIQTSDSSFNDPFFKNLLIVAKSKKDYLDKNTNSLIEQQKVVTSWNEYLIKTLPQRPKTVGLPIFHVTDHVYTPDFDSIAKCPELEEGHLDQPKVAKALEYLMGIHSPGLQKAVFEATTGSLSHILNNINTN